MVIVDMTNRPKRSGRGYRKKAPDTTTTTTDDNNNNNNNNTQVQVKAKPKKPTTKVEPPLPPQLCQSPQYLWHYIVKAKDIPYDISRSLTRLVMGDLFKGPVKYEMFPESLTELHLGYMFNQTIGPSLLPHSLTVLEFGHHFNQPLDRISLPPFLVKLTFGPAFASQIPHNKLPNTLLHLNLGYAHAKEFIGYSSSIKIQDGALPPDLNTLFCHDRWILPDQLPASIRLVRTKFELMRFHNVCPHWFYKHNPHVGMEISLHDQSYKATSHHHLPLTNLYMSHEEPKLTALPSTIKVLAINYLNEELQVGMLPLGLTEFHMGELYNLPIEPGHLPDKLRVLVLSVRFKQPLKIGVLPQSLTELTFGNKFNSEIGVGVLPPNLVSLKFGNRFGHGMGAGVLPQSLQMLRLGRGFAGLVDDVVIPSGIRYLDMHAHVDFVKYLAQCPSLDTLKLRILDTPYRRFSNAVVKVPSTVTSLKLTIRGRSANAREYITNLLKDNPQLTGFSVKIQKDTYNIRFLDGQSQDNNQLAVCVCHLKNNLDSSKLTFFKMDQFLSRTTTFKVFNPFFVEQNRMGDLLDDRTDESNSEGFMDTSSDDDFDDSDDDFNFFDRRKYQPYRWDSSDDDWDSSGDWDSSDDYY
ncbi:hypothetical protein SAMD00019534_114820 [Acytostelium subglobosum LB1]|uniref:hypothetical protein n=1 Tax=Acytostelium subglobosum LB1 TaxID=1410327 RepID=UPI000644AA7D|nr:hypothetical protein SAMD00019534_114820 [Acytostelium subglobosum LB1]GAM28306.1 hypothetical protein SAMD00019534_114820 [Acytostelium subglobosum LB1]|eukprot:XP_012748623.1 hypothetical protein SAMD00019534_114820 [Acytostelium subglobosum LB1]